MLILLCGIPASGKSTKRKELEMDLPYLITLSSDELRGVIGKDENDQSVSYIVFKTMENMTKYFLQKNKDVLIDATNLSIKRRKAFIDIAREFNVKVIAYVMKVDIELAKLRNANRPRNVPDSVIDKMFSEFVHPVVGEVDEVYVETP